MPSAIDPYLAALTDWLACAAAGASARGPRSLLAAGDGLLDRIGFAGAAGHVLDFDDTFADGIAHVSAATAPAALGLAAARGATLGEALSAYAAGFEAMAALAAASHPALYDGGWHPTTVCGPVGAAVAAASLLDLDPDARGSAVALALLRAGGSRGAFGSDGKAIQVGLASAAGVQAALAAQAGAVVDLAAAVQGPLGILAVTGASWPAAGLGAPHAAAGNDDAAAGIARNWMKLHPSCLGTHAPIDCAIEAAEAGLELRRDGIEIVVHPVARQAAHVETVTEPLGAKFSIAYCVAFTLLHGAPTVNDFLTVDDAALSASGLVSVRVDPSLPEFGAALVANGRESFSVPCPRGTPERPASADELAEKVRSLAGERLLDAVTDLDAPAARAWSAAGLP